MRLSVLVASFCIAALPALAQSPSADDIINGLKPSAKQLTGPTRGIRPVTVVGPDGKTVTTKVPAASPSAPAEEPSVKLVVDFETGSAVLSPTATKTLDSLGHALTSKTLASFRFRVEGHTDTVGAPDANKTLSERRAEAVAEFLEHHFDISPSRLQPVGYGSEKLLVPTPDQTPEPRNRRVRIVNIGA
jgi:outer membrane protein OmpA-like peptidoglycan-associated protein